MAVSLIKKEEAHILRVLPMLLKKDARFRQEVSIVLSEVFASKGELERILEEMQKSREESNQRLEEFAKRFEEHDRRFELQIKELQALKKEATERFETMDKRLSLQISDLEIEMDRRFDAIKERLEVIVVAIDRQFEAMQQQMDKRFEAMQQQMDKRFEAMQQQMDKRFEAMQQQMDERFEAMDKRFEDQKDWVGKVVGGLQGRAGRNLEDVIAGTLRVALNRRDIKPESIIMRKEFLDDEGKIGPAGRSYEIDIYAHNSESMIFEIKSYAEPEDVLRFNDKAELVKEKLGIPNSSKILITLQKGRKMVDACRNLGVELV
ncbi:MAG: hypothetical protein QME81_09965 [bacterium]|nr:hypothetical protein [bacterium]